MSDARRRDAVAQFFVGDLARPVLADADDHHLRRVLRAREGEEVVVSDGEGRWALAYVRAGGLEPASEVAADPAPAPTALYLAPLKGDRSEWAVAKATELGVARLVPLVAARGVVRLSEDVAARVRQRWVRVAREAAAQARRTHLPAIGPATPVEDVPLEVVVADFDGPAPWSEITAVAVGPEGGWAPGEWGPQRRRASLGEGVLRAETAAVAAATLVTLGRRVAGPPATPGSAP